MKDKETSPTPEKERRKEHDISLQINIDEMAEALYSPPQPFAEDLTGIHVIKETENTSFKCEQCNNESSSASILQSHIDFKHNSNVPHTSKWHPNKCHICNTQLSTHYSFRSHMTSKHNFSEDIDNCFDCAESKEVGLYLPMPHQELFMQCTSCLQEEMEDS